MENSSFELGDVILLEHEIPGIPYETGIYVLLSITALKATVSLVSQDAQGLYGIDNPYTIMREDLAAFTFTGERARIKK
jgi:hypothetical protein